ncbi:hypothetical protein M569_02168, partial [Genlisea aurea]
MANIHTLVSGSGASNVHLLFQEFSTRFNGCTTAGGTPAGRVQKERGKCDHFRGSSVRVSVVGQSRRSSGATDVSPVREDSNKHVNINGGNQIRPIEIPVTCYQIIGLHDQAEKDEIVKSVMHLKTAEIEEGYTKDTLIARQDLLIDVRDKLLFEPIYAGNIKDKQLPKSSLCISWNWLPGALCLLQEVGEEKLVLEIGRKALQNSESKPFVHDLLLSMALAECTIAKSWFEKSNISQGFEALARAQCLLRSKNSLGKMMLLSEIEESLEELAPACTLDLLGMPQKPENAERRIGAIAALRELLRQGLDVEASCRVQDWACFLGQALKKLMAAEIVELVNWDGLALIRKNKKSLDSQNQRVVVDSKNFYVVTLAHIALGFTSRQNELISKAKMLCECLITAEGIELKFEESFCSFLLGQVDETTAVESLRQLQRSSSLSSQDTLQKNESKEASTANKLLESWLKESVLSVFADTRDCSSSLAEFFSGDKRGFKNKQCRISASRRIPIAVSRPSDQRHGESLPGSAVKQLAPLDLRNPLAESSEASGAASLQLKRSFGTRQHGETRKSWPNLGKTVLAAAAVACCVSSFSVFGSIKLLRGWSGGPRSASFSTAAATLRRTAESLLVKKIQPEEPPRSHYRTSSSSLASGGIPMSSEDAEALVKRWQESKAKALGPEHDIPGLVDVLEGSMLLQWEALADAAKSRSCFWRFVLLRLSIVQAETWKEDGGEVAEIEAVLEEAAELVVVDHQNQLTNPTYCSPYRIRYLLKKRDGSWRFCQAQILTP